MRTQNRHTHLLFLRQYRSNLFSQPLIAYQKPIYQSVTSATKLCILPFKLVTIVLIPASS
uniref:Uncharacterized protein n=1 Tax=Rhizophora mucronata TaxID=61149 RepID=A0A2P2IZH2_RHIMU